MSSKAVSYDVVVIGGGVAGMSTAAALSERGARTLVLERNQLASGSTVHSAGVVARINLDPLAQEVRVRSVGEVDRLAAEGSVTKQTIGSVKPIRSEDDIPGYEACIEISREYGFNSNRIISQAEFSELFPHIVADDFVAALFSPEDGFVDGHQLCGALWDRARERGAELQTKTPLVGYEFDDRMTRHRLTTSRGVVECESVVNAAGAWAPTVAEMCGVTVPCVPQRHQVVFARLAEDLDYRMPFFAEHLPKGDERLYFRHEQGRDLIVGVHSSDLQESLGSVDPDNYKQSVDDAYVEMVARLFEERVNLKDSGFAPAWTGIYPMSPDDQYIVGPHQDNPTIVACAGLGGVGISSGCALGRLAAEWVLDGEATSLSDPDALLPDRDSLIAPVVVSS